MWLVLAGLVWVASSGRVRSGDLGWEAVPGILKRIQAPTFPARDFAITNYGAIGDGQTDCTLAFAKAIATCHDAGGGRVVVPPGTYLTGAIHLKSRVNLYVSEGATIRFSTDARKYLPTVFTRFECTEVMNYSPLIYAFEQQDIAVTGPGTLDGQGSRSNWWGWTARAADDVRALVKMGNEDVPVAQRVFGEGHFLRPNLLQPCRCTNVLIEGVTVKNSPMWTIHPLYCRNVTVRQVTVQGNGPNTDGCDPDSCADVLIEKCLFNTGDDCIAIKSGRDRDGHRVGLPSENIVIRECVMQNGHGGITCGSETAGDIRNVFAEDCKLNSPNLNMALRFKTSPERGGVIENVWIRKCVIQSGSKSGIDMTMNYGWTAGGSRPLPYVPVMRNIEISDSSFANVPQAIFIEGLSEGAKISNIRIIGCSFENVTKENTLKFVEGLRLQGVTINGKPVQ
jgi:polygalacturonase